MGSHVLHDAHSTTTYLSTYLSIYLSTYLSIYLSISLPLYLSTSTYLPTYLSIYLSLLHVARRTLPTSAVRLAHLVRVRVGVRLGLGLGLGIGLVAPTLREQVPSAGSPGEGEGWR